MKISFRNRDEAGLSLVIVLSVAILAGCLWFLWKGPKPDNARAKAKLNIARQKMSQEVSNGILLAGQSKKQSQKNLEAQVWQHPTEEIGPEALKNIGKIAADHHVKVEAFRPQRISSQDGLDIIPFQLALNGKFVDVLEFARKLEDPASKLAVSQVQISSADGNSDKVSGIVNITAYRQTEAHG